MDEATFAVYLDLFEDVRMSDRNTFFLGLGFGFLRVGFFRLRFGRLGASCLLSTQTAASLALSNDRC